MAVRRPGAGTTECRVAGRGRGMFTPAYLRQAKRWALEALPEQIAREAMVSVRSDDATSTTTISILSEAGRPTRACSLIASFTASARQPAAGPERASRLRPQRPVLPPGRGRTLEVALPVRRHCA